MGLLSLMFDFTFWINFTAKHLSFGSNFEFESVFWVGFRLFWRMKKNVFFDFFFWLPVTRAKIWLWRTLYGFLAISSVEHPIYFPSAHKNKQNQALCQSFWIEKQTKNSSTPEDIFLIILTLLGFRGSILLPVHCGLLKKLNERIQFTLIQI